MSAEYRITFFFGPADAAGRPETVVCVFNVKKRSWKGGVQVAVEMAKPQLERLQERMQLNELLEMIRGKSEPAEFADYEYRARELFVQKTCRLKLDLVTQHGIRQENQTIAPETLVEELDRAASLRAEEIRLSILAELDI